ncbi:hypothetical protein RRG08_051868 [Elysia crispata]|uniref:Uncharacterized protein n=1 Tax=Elysia crispata TaxID=231223 RepID=A0AAE0Z9L5_9GAST|nr:hypothetical protein RRG08_051868 [Elysia crispata]
MELAKHRRGGSRAEGGEGGVWRVMDKPVVDSDKTTRGRTASWGIQPDGSLLAPTQHGQLMLARHGGRSARRCCSARP